MQLNNESIRYALKHYAKSQGFTLDEGKNDGYTWITLIGESITPEKYKELSQGVADACGVDFYFNSIRVGSIEGPIDWDMFDREKYTDDPHCDLDSYGTKFVSTPQAKKLAM